MAKGNLLDTSTVTFSEIVGNGKIYRVPTFQRDYSWREENWEDLWTDVTGVIREGRQHYMGSIVLQSMGNKNYTIIDGQQRLATLSILALATIKRLRDLVDSNTEETANRERIDILMNKFIGSKTATSLRYSSKLFLNENNDPFYQAYLVQLRTPIHPAKLKDSEKLLWQAFQFFYGQTRKLFDHNQQGVDMARFLDEQVAEKLMFIQIVVEDELSAYTVFETLNARGVGLTVTDLLKNYLFSIAAISPTDQEHVKNQWTKIIQLTDLEYFPIFLRHYWNSRNDLVRQESLFKTVRETVHTPQQVFDLLDNLERAAGVYVAFSNSGDELWQGNKEIRKRVRELELFRVKQCYPLLLIGYEKLSLDEFTKVLRICTVISFRYTVIGGLNPNTMEDVYNKTAKKVYSGLSVSAGQIANELKGIYPSDEDFKNAFSTKSIHSRRNRSLVRYILYALENQMAGTDRDFEEETGTTEHILPENPSGAWEIDFHEDIQQDFIYRLGNYTLLESGKNNECQNKSYADKLPLYHSSQYQMTKAIGFPEWSPNRLKSRQSQLAKYAAGIWKHSH